MHDKRLETNGKKPLSRVWWGSLDPAMLNCLWGELGGMGWNVTRKPPACD